jgi:L-amino acid N-acyltransferase
MLRASAPFMSENDMASASLDSATIRDATGADMAAVAAIWNPVIRDTFVTFNSREFDLPTLDAMRAARQTAGHAFLVLEAPGGGITGFATFRQFRDGPGSARTFEHTIVLAPQAQGCGHGRRLMAEIEDRARRAEGRRLWAGVSAANPAGRHFHAALGYEEIAVLPEVGCKAGQWIDLILMCKRL